MVPMDLTPMPEESDNLLPVALEQRGVSAEQRMFSPSAARNSVPILAVLKRVLPTPGVVLEIGCGTGEHAVCFAEAMPKPHLAAKRCGFRRPRQHRRLDQIYRGEQCARTAGYRCVLKVMGRRANGSV